MFCHILLRSVQDDEFKAVTWNCFIPVILFYPSVYLYLYCCPEDSSCHGQGQSHQRETDCAGTTGRQFKQPTITNCTDYCNPDGESTFGTRTRADNSKFYFN